MKFINRLLQSAGLNPHPDTQARASTKESEDLFRRVFDQSPIPIVLVTMKDSRLLEANPAAISTFGFADRRHIGSPLADLGIWHDPADQLRYRASLQQTGSITGFEVSMLTQARRKIDLMMSGSVVTIGGQLCTINFLLDLTEHKRAVVALGESEEKFRRLFDQSPMIIAVLSVPEGRLIELNRAGLVSFGLDRETAIGRTTAELAVWVDRAERERYLQLLVATGTVNGFEAQLRSRDGEVHTVLCSGSLLKVGTETWSLNTLQDITGRKRAEATRDKSASLVRATLESTADGILAIDADGRIESYNRIFAEMWRLPEDILNSRDDDRALQWVLSQLKVPDQFIQKVRHLYAHPAEESFDTLEFVDGRIFERYSRPMLINGRPTGRVWSFRDITLRRAAEAAMRDSEEKFHGVFDKSPIIMGLLTVPDGRFVEVNAAGEAAFGFTREEAIGRTSAELNVWANSGDRERYLQLLKTNGAVSAYETQMRRKNGELFTVLYNGSLIRLGNQAYSLNILQDISERKRTEKSLRTSEQRYERVVQNISDALLIDDVAGHIVFANDRFRQLLGLPRGDLHSVRLEDYVAPEYRTLLRDRHDRRVRGEPVPDRYDYEAVRVDGTRLWIEVNVTTVVENGFITGTQSLNRDITDRKISEQAMLLLSTGTATLRGHSYYEHVAKEIARLFSADLGMVARCRHPAPDRARTLGLCLDGQALPALEYAMVDTPCIGVFDKKCVVYPTAVARLFPKVQIFTEQKIEGYAAAPMRAQNGEVIGHVAIASRRPIRHNLALLESVLQMIAFKVAAEFERQRAESMFRDLFSSAPDAVLIATQQGVITDANRRAVELFGYSHAELLHLSVAELIPPAVRPELLRRLSTYLADPVPHAMGASAPGLLALNKAGRSFPIDISLSPLDSEQGLLVVAAIRDITDQIQAAAQHQQIEAQLRQAQKMESLGTLAGGIAHDFNNILTGMLGFVELTRMDLPADHPAQQWIRNLAASGDRAKNLVRQILTFSRKDEGEQTPLRLQAVAEEAVRLLRATIPPMIGIETAFQMDCPPIMADANQMHQVLVNLCTNAWHAMPEKGGHIRVELATCPPPPDSDAGGSAEPAGPFVRLTVSDDGTGMDAPTLDRIFDPFFTTKKTGQGTGLGLAVVHGIVQSHAGVIKVRSTPGQGTTFELYFPAINAPVPGSAAAAGEQLPQGRGEHCLLVDDDNASRQAVSHLLTRLGYRVTVHHDPLAALAAFRATPTEFVLVISDLAMPGMTGIEFARHVRAAAPAMPLLVVSGFVAPAQLQQLRALGVKEILRKPPTLDELGRAVARSLGRSAAR